MCRAGLLWGIACKARPSRQPPACAHRPSPAPPCGADWADDRRPDHVIGDRVFLPGQQWCTPLATNIHSNPKFTVSLGDMASGAGGDAPGSARWESYRMEMDTWWLRSFAVSVWQGVTAWLGHTLDVGFPDVPPPWPMNDKSSFNAFGPHVTVSWVSGLY